MPQDPYTLEQAGDDLADLRGQVDALGEYITTSQLAVSGPVTATGGSVTSPSVVSTDSWNTATSLNHGWTGTVAWTLLPLNDLAALYVHLNCTGATTLDGTNICTIPAAYRPASVFQWISVVTDVLRTSGGGTEGPGIYVDSTGSVQCQGISSSASWVRGSGIYRLSL